MPYYQDDASLGRGSYYAELHEALKQARIEQSLKDASTMINVLSPAKGNKNGDITLGLTLTSEVAVEEKSIT